jgi:ABC-type polysaccharide/polyol phosphate transport system ATPase subunit
MSLVVVDKVHVDFPIYGNSRNFRRALFQRATGGFVQYKEDRVIVKALSDISFTLDEGDRIGLIGHNGAGKSTLLKVLAGIYEPVSGQVLVGGKTTPLFDTMPGLDPEDSGYENIVTAGLLLGMSRDEIENRIPDIEQFSELGEYLSLPVRTYSAGMQARLGFSLVTTVDPEILLMDEAIGTGDARFTDKVAERLKNFVDRSSILVLASHSVDLVKRTCNKAALMSDGRILAIGAVEEVLADYDRLIHGQSPPAPEPSPG